jgi:hypothetical protein
MDEIVDAVKTASVGFSGIFITWIDWLPVAVRVAVGMATFIYMLYKAKNEWFVYESRKKENSPPSKSSKKG